MKAFFIATITGLLIASLSATGQEDSKIQILWKHYEKTDRMDQPQKALDILTEIKKEALGKTLAWDYYHAGEEYVNKASSIDWEKRAELERQFGQECMDFPAAINEFCHKAVNNGNEELYAVISDRHESLKRGHNPQFYSSWMTVRNTELRGYLTEKFQSDLEYALWAIVAQKVRGYEKAQAELAEIYSSEPILSAILEYETLEEGREDSFIARHRSEAVALPAEADLLRKEFYSLNVKKNSSDEFLTFRKKCEAFEKRRHAFKGEEKKLADCVLEVSEIIKSLDEKQSFFEIDNGTLKVIFKNRQSARIKISNAKDKNCVYEETIRGDAGKYYVPDTVSRTLPVFDDGDYTLEFISEQTAQKDIPLSKNTMALCHRYQDGKLFIYAADYMSGKPFDKVDLSCKKGQKQVQAIEGFKLNGFTQLDASEADVLECRVRSGNGVLQKSGEVYIHRGKHPALKPSNEKLNTRYSGMILTDSRAFHPGECVRFKLIMSEWLSEKERLVPMAEGTEVEIRLHAPSGEMVDSQKIALNDFGSAAGSFLLGKDYKRGHYNLSATIPGRKGYCQISSLILDDFILPNFDICFDESTQLRFAGELVHVKGRVISYSGRSLSECKATYTINDSYSSGNGQPLEIMDDGSFDIAVKTDAAESYVAHYNINVKLVDGTGETNEFINWFLVSSRLDLSARLQNKSEGECLQGGKSYGRSSIAILRDKCASIKLCINDQYTDFSRTDIQYRIFRQGSVIQNWSPVQGGHLDSDFSTFPEGIYTLEFTATAKDENGSVHSGKSKLSVLWLGANGRSLPEAVENVFIPDDENGRLFMGGTEGPIWAVIDIFGPEEELIEEQLIQLGGKNPKAKDISFTTRKNWPSSVSLHVLYFRNGNNYQYSHNFTTNNGQERSLPLAFSFETDCFAPSTTHKLLINTRALSECAVSIFDKSSEKIAANLWHPFIVPENVARHPSFFCSNGYYSAMGYPSMYKDISVSDNAYGRTGRNMLMSAAATKSMDLAVSEESVDMQENFQEDIQESVIREDFSTTLAFEPLLTTGADGSAKMEFRTSDKLSTFVVQAFVHDKQMRSAVKRDEILVSLPVQLSLVEPKLLYSGDECLISTVLSNKEEEDISGKLQLTVYDGSKRSTASVLERQELKVATKAQKATKASFRITVPNMKEGAQIGILLSFTPNQENGTTRASDALFTAIPVKRSVQAITEAHSAIFHPGDNMDSICDSLRSAFINMPGIGARRSERSIKELMSENLDCAIAHGGKNALSLSETLYAELLRSSLTDRKFDADSLCNLLLKCKCDNGGFAWFPGMKASAIVTAVVLDRIASMKRQGFLPERLELAAVPAVEYLDKYIFTSKNEAYYPGWISLEQYLAVRSLFPEVKLGYEVPADFKKNVKAYLVPGKVRGLNGQILSNARRIKTLNNLATSEEGANLSKALGIKLATGKRIEKSLAASLESLLQYAVRHSSGGANFPNAVMPFRGLLENEAYAHAYIADLLREYSAPNELASRCCRMADDICLWLMIQKETQNWDGEPLCIEALASMSKASSSVLNTSVVSLKKTREMDFDEIAATGNGMSIERHYYREKVDKDNLVSEGDTLHTGDKLIAVYKIHNDENRSFVLLKAWYPACLRPVDQLSGICRWSKLARNPYGRIQPLSYREVKAGCSEYWFDCYPEGESEVVEEFFVTQSGVFRSPVTEIESTYARHYRANSATDGKMTAKVK